MNYLDLFSGIGGFALGAYWAGMKFDNHYFSDIEKYAVELYQKRFPDAIPLGDITKIDCSKLPQGEWIITGGFPCQDISIAGKGKGLIDEEGNKTRSGLWFIYAELISKLRPRYAIMENVGAITHRGLDAVLGSLAEIGYDAEWQDIRAEDMGAPHKRERIWIVAYPTSDRRSRQGQTAEVQERLQPRPESAGELESRPERCGAEMADTTEQGRERRETREQGEHTQCREGLSRRGGAGEIPNTDNEGLEGWQEAGNLESQGQNGKQYIERQSEPSRGSYWAAEPTVCELVDGLPAGMERYEGRLTTKSYKRVDQLKGLGNSIVPQIAELLFRQINEV